MTSRMASTCWGLSLAGVLKGFFPGLLILTSLLQAQPGAQGPSPVRYTVAREHSFRGMVELPASVEARRVSMVAAGVEGRVIEFAVRVGDVVKQDQPLARLRTRNRELQLAASEAQLSEAEARLKLAERNRDRAQELFDSQVFSREELDRQVYEFEAQRAGIERLKAEIERIRDDIARCTIEAPFDGVVIAEHTQTGQWLATGDPVAEVLSTSDLEVSVDVPERYFTGVRPGSHVQIVFDALQKTAVTGTVRTVVPRADEQARTFPLKLRFKNPGGRVAVGMLCSVRFPAGSSYTATIVPKDAIVMQGNQAVVFLMQNGAAQPVPVTAGAGAGAWIEVRGAVKAGQQVVTRGNERLFPGQPVAGEELEYQVP